MLQMLRLLLVVSSVVAAQWPDELKLLKEVKVYKLLPSVKKDTRWEASGVAVGPNNTFEVVFDNSAAIARVDADLPENDPRNVLWGDVSDPAGFEGYSINEDTRYAITETAKLPSGEYSPLLTLIRAGGGRSEACSLPMNFSTENKGIEGARVIRLNDRLFLLGLCEGNSCAGGEEGKDPGHGRVQVFEQTSSEGAGPCNGWVHHTELKLPSEAQFEDYSGLDVDVDTMQIVVVSQSSSQMLLGKLVVSEDIWMVQSPRVYGFPLDEDGHVVYCNVEGVGMIDRNRLVVASDKAKSDQHKRCRDKDQTVHVFQLPN